MLSQKVEQPIAFRINTKFLTLTYKALHDQPLPISLASLPTILPCSLQCHHTGLLAIPVHTRHNLTSGPFYLLFPLLPWNTLPPNSCVVSSLYSSLISNVVSSGRSFLTNQFNNILYTSYFSLIIIYVIILFLLNCTFHSL